MSVDILTNISKEAVSKNPVGTTSKSEVPEKKEGTSLFDSLMNDIQQEKKPVTTETKQMSKKSDKKETKTLSPNTQTITKSKEETKEVSKKVSQELVDLVVDKVKNKSEKETGVSKDTNLVEKTSKVIDNKDSHSAEKATKTIHNQENNIVEKATKSVTSKDIKTNIETSTTTIKDAVEDIKLEVAKIGLEKSQKISKEEDVDSPKEIKKPIEDEDDIQQTTPKKILVKNGNEIKSNIETSAKKITNAVKDIKVEVSKATDEIDTIVVEDADDTGKLKQKKILLKNTDELKTKIKTSTIIIKDAVADIKEQVSKIEVEKLEENPNIEKETKKSISAPLKIVVDIEKNEDKSPKEKIVTNPQEIKVKIDTSTTKIEDATQQIDQEISQLQNYEENEITRSNIKVNSGENSKGNLSQPTFVNQHVVVDKKREDHTIIDGKTTLLANGFLNNQQKNKQTVSLTQISNAKENIEKNKSLKSIKDSATMLDLNIEKVAVEHSDQSGKVEKLDILSKQEKDTQLQMLQNRGFNRFLVEKENYSNNEQQVKTQELEKAASVDSQMEKEKNIILNVPQTVVETIETKIIGAQQKIGNFMSEVARNMYLNYKPPFTAFRMNLNPANLGSIAVVMRASKTDNSVTVSMNMNNNSTIDLFTENKTALQTALQKQLGESSTVSLNFNTQDNNSSEQFGQSSQNSNSNGQNNKSNTSEEPTNLNIEEENTEELDYM